MAIVEAGNRVEESAQEAPGEEPTGDEAMPKRQPTTPAGEKTAKVVESNVPSGGLIQTYGAPVTAGAITVALLEFLKSQGSGSGTVLAMFGPKWIYFGALTFVLWDLAKRALKLAGRGVAHLGELAANAGRAADGVQAFAAKNDRTAEEQARLTAFAVQTSQRAVELSSETLMETKRNGELLQEVLKRAVPGA